MGYQVGATCYPDLQLAENIYFSQVVPVLTDNGILQMQYTKQGWYYNGKKAEISLPQCSPLDNFKLGAEMGMALVPTAVVLATTLLIVRMFK